MSSELPPSSSRETNGQKRDKKHKKHDSDVKDHKERKEKKRRHTETSVDEIRHELEHTDLTEQRQKKHKKSHRSHLTSDDHNGEKHTTSDKRQSELQSPERPLKAVTEENGDHGHGSSLSNTVFSTKDTKIKKEKKKRRQKDKPKDKSNSKGSGHADDATRDTSHATPSSSKAQTRTNPAETPSTILKKFPKDIAYQPPDCPSPPELHFPFYRQTVELTLPLYPIGFGNPVVGMVDQHLAPRVGSYIPYLRGVLLRVDAAGAHLKTQLLRAEDSYAAPLGCLVATVDLFVPQRGVWMEGTIALQSEGHLGLVCWKRFNASVEQRRLPKGWRWIPMSDADAEAEDEREEDEGRQDEEDPFAEPEAMEMDAASVSTLAVQQMHTTGYWVDAEGKRVKGKVRFRIRNYEVGVAGDFGYLSMEGTMLSRAEEDDLNREERAEEEQKKAGGGSRFGSRMGTPGARPVGRDSAAASGAQAIARKGKPKAVPEFSVTRLDKEAAEEEDSGGRQVFSFSRAGSED